MLLVFAITVQVITIISYWKYYSVIIRLLKLTEIIKID